MLQIKEDRIFYRLYREHRDWCPEVRAYTKTEEAKINPQNFITPYRYSDFDQAERAMIYHIKRQLNPTERL